MRNHALQITLVCLLVASCGQIEDAQTKNFDSNESDAQEVDASEQIDHNMYEAQEAPELTEVEPQEPMRLIGAGGSSAGGSAPADETASDSDEVLLSDEEPADDTPPSSGGGSSGGGGDGGGPESEPVACDNLDCFLETAYDNCFDSFCNVLNKCVQILSDFDGDGVAACGTGEYEYPGGLDCNDRDPTLWADCDVVEEDPEDIECDSDPDCQNGLFCDGEEFCLAGACYNGAPVMCDDSTDCTQDRCDEARDYCIYTPIPGSCAETQYCDNYRTLGCTDSRYPDYECNDNWDNDEDGLMDCEDPDCEYVDSCLEPEDLDGDGYTSDVDCNDLDSSTHPGARDECDNYDNNCNGELDEDYEDLKGQPCHSFNEHGLCDGDGSMKCNEWGGLSCSVSGPYGSDWTRETTWCEDGYDRNCNGYRYDNCCDSPSDCGLSDEVVEPCTANIGGIPTSGRMVCGYDFDGCDSACVMDCAVGTAEICGDGIDNTCDGNIDEGCTIEVHPARILVRLARVGHDTVVKGSQDVNVLSLSIVDLMGGHSSDLTLRNLSIYAVGDNDGSFTDPVTGDEDMENDVPINEHISSCSLYSATTGALIEITETASFGSFYFNSMREGLEDDVTRIDMTCNFVPTNTLGDEDDVYGFGIVNASSIVLEDSDGNRIPSESIVFESVDSPSSALNLDPPEYYTVVKNHGYLNVEKCAENPRSKTVLGDSTRIATACYKFTAHYENFVVKELQFDNCLGNSLTSLDECAHNLFGVQFGDDGAIASTSINYTNIDGTSVSHNGFLVEHSIDLDLFGGGMPVTQDWSAYLWVYTNTNSVGPTGAASGAQYQANLNMVPGTGHFVADGVFSGERLTENDMNQYITSNTMTLRKTQLTISMASGSPSGAAIPGWQEILRLGVCADPRGWSNLNWLDFNLVTTDSAESGWNTCGALIDDDDWGLYNTSEIPTSLGAPCSLEDVLTNFGMYTLEEVIIVAGTCEEFPIWMDSTEASAIGDDSIRLDLVGFSRSDEGLVDDVYDTATVVGGTLIF
ncbi:MAG: putative metal-binding motif-containing protein [Patescibacteria group bacterium]